MKRLAMLPGPWQGLFGHAMRLIDAGRYLVRHRQAFVDQLRSREAILRKVFAGIDFIGDAASFDECVAIATEFLAALPAGGAVGGTSA